MPNPATVDDLVKRSLRPLSDDEKRVGGQWLEDAWAIMTTQKPFVAEKVATDTPYRGLVVQILCAMVIRVLNNPDGKYQESGDDYSYSRDSAVSTGALYISDSELGLIGDTDGVGSGAFTIKPAGWFVRSQPDPWSPMGSAP
jgi:hypothetical protein